MAGLFGGLRDYCLIHGRSCVWLPKVSGTEPAEWFVGMDPPVLDQSFPSLGVRDTPLGTMSLVVRVVPFAML